MVISAICFSSGKQQFGTSVGMVLKLEFMFHRCLLDCCTVFLDSVNDAVGARTKAGRIIWDVLTRATRCLHKDGLLFGSLMKGFRMGSMHGSGRSLRLPSFGGFLNMFLGCILGLYV